MYLFQLSDFLQICEKIAENNRLTTCLTQQHYLDLEPLYNFVPRTIVLVIVGSEPDSVVTRSASYFGFFAVYFMRN